MTSSKNILFLINSFDIGGTERYLYTLCTICKNIFNTITVASAPGIWIDKIKVENISYLQLKIMSKFSFFAFFINLYKLNKYIGDNHINILHVQSRIFFIIIPFISKNVKIVYTAHCFFNDKFQRMVKADYIIAISEHIKSNILETTKIKNEKILVIPNGVECNKEPVNLTERNLSFGYVGRIEKNKGVKLLVKAFVMLLERYKEIHLFIHGDGKLKHHLIDYVKKHESSANIIFGNKSIDLNVLYSNFSVLVYPTFFNENIPLSALEAIAEGKLIMLTKTLANKQILKNGENCFLLDTLSVNSVTNKVEEVFNYPLDKLNEIRRNAYFMIKNEYSIEKMIASYISFFLNYF